MDTAFGRKQNFKKGSLYHECLDSKVYVYGRFAQTLAS